MMKYEIDSDLTKIAKWYAEMTKCKVVFTDYRLLPQNKYPVAVEDCYCTYKWILNNADMLGINRNKIIVAGDSAGGNIAAAVTLMLWDRVQVSMNQITSGLSGIAICGPKKKVNKLTGSMALLR